VKKKFRKIFNTRVIKQKRSYSTQEISDLFGVHVATVQSWYGSGLKKIDDKRPAVVFGELLANFLNKKNKKGKRRCGIDEFFCCKCKNPRKSEKNKVHIKVVSIKRVMIVGICERCGTKMNRSGVPSKITKYKKVFDVQEIQEEHLLGCVNTGVNTSEKEGEESG